MKTKVLFIITACVILLSGCARTNEEALNDKVITENPGSVVENQPEEIIDVEKEETISEETPPVKSEEPTIDMGTSSETESLKPVALPIPDDTAVFSSISSLKASFTLEDYVVFKGKKVASLGDMGERMMFPIQLKVNEVYYGDLQKDQTVVMREIVGEYNKYDDVIFKVGSGDLEKIEDDVEYIFILRKTVDSETGEEYYTYVSRNHTFSKISDRASLAGKVQKGTATKLEQFRSSVLETYLNNPDTRLELHAEASKLVSGIPEDATEEEILTALPAEQKTLFENLIKQYGTK